MANLKLFEKTYRITFTDELLGTMPGDREIFKNFVAGKAETMNEEAEAIPIDVEDELEKGTTVFPRTADGQPFIYDYQIRGFFKEACKFLKKVPKTRSSTEKAYKQKIDGMIFVKDRANVITVNGNIGICERPLRASTPQGDRVALSRSESIPEGSSVTFTAQCMVETDLKLIEEWLEYGELHGTGQWRNGGKGRFTYVELDKDGNVKENKKK